MPNPTPPLLQVTDLVKTYGRVQALQGVSLSANSRAIGLLGPNGSGKSTLIKVLLGLLKPTSGTASVLGLDSRRDALRIRQLTGFMPESECLIPRMSAVQYVTLAGQLVGMPAGDALARAHDVLHALDLGEARYRDIDTYSTGMLQRVKLAQALVHHPKLMFLDEPTNGLDPKGRDDMLALIRDISQRKGINVVLSSHILHDVESVCDELIVLHRGRLIASGPLAKIIGIAESALDVRFRGDRAALEGAMRAEGLSPRKMGEEADRMLVPVADVRQTAPVLRAAAKAGAQIRHMAPAKKSLDDVFAGMIEAADK
ncbi:MAG: ABC transporter ATP-binding protein [Planctomycetes bacterium]|nr:ABC transporter ATP-binding protein [Planctomycetota bacterium]